MKFLIENTDVLAGWSKFFEPAVGKGFVILAFVFAMMTPWRRRTATARHLAWTMTFLCLLCLPVFVQCLPTWRAPAWMVPPVVINGLPQSLHFGLQGETSRESKAPPTHPAKAADAHGAFNSSQWTVSISSFASWSDLAAAIWFAGSMMGLARLLLIQIRLERMTRRLRPCENQAWRKWIGNLRIEYRIRRPVRLLISEASASPMTWGFCRPVIALPAESLKWTEERLRVVLRHELAHVKRWDCLTQEIASLACALYWFNPLMWLAARRMRAEREKACDDFVLNAGARPPEYANHLVEIARQFSATAHPGGVVAMARPSGLEQRVAAILDGRTKRNAIGNTAAVALVLGIFGLGLLIGGCAIRNSPGKWSLQHSEISTQLKSFVAEKEAQAAAATETNGQQMPAEFKSFFAAAAKGDWLAVSNDFENFRQHAPQYEHSGKTDLNLRGTAWQAAIEIWGTFDNLANADEKYSIVYGRDIIHSIPPGSVYFGGTDPGRFLITGMEKSQVNADPFFLLTQNALADRTYLDYLRSMYGDKIYIPTKEDLQKCFRDYTEDAKQRLQNHQLKPDENFKLNPDGTVQVSGKVAVMQINGLLAKVIFDKNPDRQFYIEESFPLDWMYPYLEPHGLIFKINRRPLAELSDEIVQRNDVFWSKTIQPMIGNWLNSETSVQKVAAFVKKVFLQHNFSEFNGDPQFVENEYSCKIFSKERANIADLYVWRMNHAATADERERMAREADFAYRQALALCPYSSETVKGYARFLRNQNRQSDAALVTETAAQFSSASSELSKAESHKPAAGLAESSVFQVRLVQNGPSNDAERMALALPDNASGRAQTEQLYVQKAVLLDQSVVKSAKVVKHRIGQPSIEVVFTDSGRERFAEITRQNIHKRLAIIIDGQVFCAPIIQTEIPDGIAEISGAFSDEQAESLAAKINQTVGE